MGFETPITIEKVIKGMQENKYVLPAIQREFVWDDEQVEKFLIPLCGVTQSDLFFFGKLSLLI